MLVANTALGSGPLPLTRRDILPEVESPLLLTANNLPVTSQEHLDERDTKNTHQSMTAGQKRTKDVQRSDSYRRATERLSVHDSVEEIREELEGYIGEESKRKDNNDLNHASSNVTNKSKKESLFSLRIFFKKVWYRRVIGYR